MADIRHLAAAEHGAIDVGIAANPDDGIGHTPQVVFY